MKYEYYEIDGDKISIPRPESYKDCFTLVKSDRFRISGKVDSTFKILLDIIKPFKINTLFWYRLSLYKGLLYPFCRVMLKCSCRKNHTNLHPDIRIGYGLYMGLSTSIYINPKTVIGNNVNISQFLNMGTNNRTAATVGDNVYIGPMVCVVENPKIGSNVTIGAGALVNKDIPANATAVGVPAKVVNSNSPGRFNVNRWPIDK